MSYYRGDYYQGDFWSSLGKGVKRVVRDIGNVAKTIAPVAGFVLPVAAPFGIAAKLVGKAQQIKRAGRGITQAISQATQSTVAQPNPHGSPVLIASQLTGSTIGLPSTLPVENPHRPMAPLPATLPPDFATMQLPRPGTRKRAKRRKRQSSSRARARSRTAYRRRKTTTRRKATRRRY